MNQEIKRKWVEALRLGHYEQGRTRLRISSSPKPELSRLHLDKYCCLGVLCDLIFPKEWVEDESDGWFHASGGSVPGGLVMEIAELEAEDAEKLVRLNDGGLAFEAIADYIEKKL